MRSQLLQMLGPVTLVNLVSNLQLNSPEFVSDRLWTSIVVRPGQHADTINFPTQIKYKLSCYTHIILFRTKQPNASKTQHRILLLDPTPLHTLRKQLPLHSLIMTVRRAILRLPHEIMPLLALELIRDSHIDHVLGRTGTAVELRHQQLDKRLQEAEKLDADPPQKRYVGLCERTRVQDASWVHGQGADTG